MSLSLVAQHRNAVSSSVCFIYNLIYMVSNRLLRQLQDLYTEDGQKFLYNQYTCSIYDSLNTNSGLYVTCCIFLWITATANH